MLRRHALQADDLQQPELPGRLGVGPGGEEYELLILLRGQERLAVDLDEADRGMDQPLVALARDLHLVLGPQTGELLAVTQERVDQVFDIRIAAPASRGGA